MSQQTDGGLTDFHDLVAQIDRRPSRTKYKPEAIATFRDASGILTDREDYQSALEVMDDEQAIEPVPPPGFYARLGAASQNRAATARSRRSPTPTPRNKSGAVSR